MVHPRGKGALRNEKEAGPRADALADPGPRLRTGEGWGQEEARNRNRNRDRHR